MENSLARAVARPVAWRSLVGAFALALAAGNGCARSARGPPRLALDIALARARQALCTAGGVESPRALVEAMPIDPVCPAGGAAARVRCYLARPDTALDVTPISGGYRLRFTIPALSDHVHEVSVRQGRDGEVRLELVSAN